MSFHSRRHWRRWRRQCRSKNILLDKRFGHAATHSTEYVAADSGKTVVNVEGLTPAMPRRCHSGRAC
jgi:hypothetical protein